MREAGAQLAHTVDEALLLFKDEHSVYLITTHRHEAQQLAVSQTAFAKGPVATALGIPLSGSCVLQSRWRQVQSKPATSLRPDWLVHCLSRLMLMPTANYEHALPVTCI